jgi:hypothetical protein
MQCQLILTCAAIWQYIALHLHHTTHSWRVVIVKAGPYDRKEMETWKHWLNADGHVIADMAQNADTIERYGNLVSITMMAALPSSYPGLFQATELPCDLKGQMDNGERLVEDVQTFMGLSPVSIPIWDGQDWDTPSYRGSLISRFSCNGSDSMVQEVTNYLISYIFKEVYFEWLLNHRLVCVDDASTAAFVRGRNTIYTLGISDGTELSWHYV